MRCSHTVSESNQLLLAGIPCSFTEIVGEIVRFSGLPQESAEHRVWMEALQLGWNVADDVKRFRATPHRFDENMRLLYRDGDGFIFETLVFWARPFRQKWTVHALDRIILYARSCGINLSTLRVLILGDGTGNDSLFLAQNGLNVDFFEVPGSKTYQFAVKRFRSRGLLDDQIHVLKSYEDCLSGQYDAVISFEVLEHLPEPHTAISDLRAMLKHGGIALVTEAFAYLADALPTHLESNRKYSGRTPILFLKNGMVLRWYSRDPLFKPMEFVKRRRPRLTDFVSMLTDVPITRLWFFERMRALKRTSKSVVTGAMRWGP
jgi:SAM-dependent methyltransferase